MSEQQTSSQGNREGGNRRPRRNNSNNNSNRNRNRNSNRNNSNRTTRPPKPLKLTFFQKILKAVGLFDEEKARKAQRQQERSPKSSSETRTDRASAPKSNVRNAKSADGGGNRRQAQAIPVESARLYVGNLSYDATEHDLEELFKGVGTVKKVEIIYNRNTHKSKGYGFIQMLSVEEAKRAVDVLHEQPFMSRQLVVNGSKSRREGDNSGAEEISETSAE